MSPTPDLTPLKEAVFAYPCIDNHTHNLLLAHRSQDPPLHIMTTEALGPPLEDVWHGLSHIRARNLLVELYGLPEGSSWEDMLEAREKMPYEEMAKFNFDKTGIQCLLLDDGLTNLAESCYPYKWHDRLTTSPTKRIFRLEPMAQDIVVDVLNNSLQASREEIMATIKTRIQAAVSACAADPEIVGFKSVACYRTGLDIQAYPDEEGDPVCGLDNLVAQWMQGKKVEIRRDEKAFEDWFIRTLLPLIGDKPLQFHTGLGDCDMLLVKSDPAWLQPLCEAFPENRIVLLHSSYPYTRQAGYLATCFKNVYLDFGEVFPQVAAHGQRDIIRQMLEITPTNKLLWSTDAHQHPECYYVSTRECREALYEVLSEIVTRGEMSVAEAVSAVQDMLFHNSNRAYNLGLEPIPTRITLPIAPEAPVTNSVSLTLDTLESSGVRYVRVHWLDYVNQLRFRIIPVQRFIKMAKSDAPGINLTYATLGLGVTDYAAKGFSGTGEHLYVFDLPTLQKLPDNVAEGHASVFGYFEYKDRSIKHRHPACPRGLLDRLVKETKEKHSATFLVGFETEFVLLDSVDPPSPAAVGGWSTSLKHRTGELATKVLEEIAETVTDAGIEVQMFHAESGPGQFEIVTGPLPPLEACDALALTRDIMYNVAAKYGLKATLVPKPYVNPKHEYGASATHVHMSLTSTPKAPASNHPDVPHLPADFASFIAGVLDHLPAVAAFTLAGEPSYERVVDGNWTGGTWVVWGRDNREAPLRLCGGYGDGFNVELKTLDGLANPYLALGAVLAAGITGVAAKKELTERSAVGIVDQMSAEEKKKIGAGKRIPKTLEAAREELLSDKVLVQALGEEVVNTWLAVRQSEKELVASWDNANAYWVQYY